jgi:periplasmic protein CpxP/Spy
MSFRWKKASFISALILGLSFSQTFAQTSTSPSPKPLAGPGMMKPPCENMMNQLGLTADQKQKIDAIMQASKAQADPIMQSMREKKTALMQYLFTPQATKEQALCKAKEISDLKYQLEGVFIDGILKAKCILTPAQQQKFLQLHQRKMMEMGPKP